MSTTRTLALGAVLGIVATVGTLALTGASPADYYAQAPDEARIVITKRQGAPGCLAEVSGELVPTEEGAAAGLPPVRWLEQLVGPCRDVRTLLDGWRVLDDSTRPALAPAQTRERVNTDGGP